MRLTAIALVAFVSAACNSTPLSLTPGMTQASPWPSPTFEAARLTCVDRYTPPPYDAMHPVAGVSLRVIDKGHFEVTNATDRDYYFKIVRWITEDLVCGRGVTGEDGFASPIASGATVAVSGGSTADLPL